MAEKRQGDTETEAGASGQQGESDDQTGAGDDQTAKGDSSREGGKGSGSRQDRYGSGEDDDIVARQLREAAENETDPELKEKLWQEYEEYKKNTGS